MKGQWWSIDICGSALDLVHGFGRRIIELHVPEAGISINSVDSSVHCFREEDGSRYQGANGRKIGAAVEIPNSLVSAAEVHLRSKANFDAEVKKWFSKNEPKPEA